MDGIVCFKCKGMKSIVNILDMLDGIHYCFLFWYIDEEDIEERIKESIWSEFDMMLMKKYNIDPIAVNFKIIHQDGCDIIYVDSESG